MPILHRIKKSWSFFFAWSLVLLFMLALNLVTPWMCDDFVFRTREGSSLGWFSKIAYSIRTANIEYTIAHGDYIGNIVKIFLSNSPRWFAGIVNFAWILGMLLFFFKICSFYIDRWMSLALTIGVILLTPSPVNVFVWTSATPHYLMPNFFMLVLFYFLHHPYKKTWMEWPIVLTSAFITGQGYGVIGGVVLLCFFVYFLLHKRGGIAIQTWFYSSVIFIIIGIFLMILAPGNSAKMSAYNLDASYHIFSSIFKYAYSFLRESLYTNILTMLIGLYFLILLLFNFRELHFVLKWKALGIFSAAYLGIIPLLLVHSPTRAFAYFPIVLLFAVALTINVLYGNDYWSSALSRMLAVIFLFVFLSNYSMKLWDAWRIRVEMNKRVSLMIDARQRGEKEITLMSFTDWGVYQRYMGGLDLDDSNHWVNQGIASFYGFDAVNSVPWKYNLTE